MKLDKTSVKKIHDAIHKMNEVITPGERNSINRFRNALWEACDKIQDISHFPSMEAHPLGKISKELKDLINLFPILMGKYASD